MLKIPEIKIISSGKEKPKKKSKNNPNKSNQFKPDPRQSLFLGYYLDPKSETFSNAYQSALKAGYEESYAATIRNQGDKQSWLKENLKNINREKLLEKAEEHLEKVLNDDEQVPVITSFGPLKDKVTGEQVMKRSLTMVGIKTDVSKFIAKHLGSDAYSEKLKVAGTLTIEDAMKKNVEDRKKKDVTFEDNETHN